MLQLCAKLCYGFASAQKYLIKKSAYLIQAPPVRPPPAFQSYLSDITKGKKGLKVTQEIKKASEQWKKLSPEVRSGYESSYKTRLEEYLKKKDEYNQKYAIPFHHANSQTLAVASFYRSHQNSVPKGASIQEYAKQVSGIRKLLTLNQQEQFKRQAEKINAERRQLVKQFMFPQRLYNSQAAFSRNHPKLYVEQRKNAYQTYLKNWEADVEAWLIKNKIQMQLSDFKRLYNRELKKKKATKAQKKTDTPAENSNQKPAQTSEAAETK